MFNDYLRTPDQLKKWLSEKEPDSVVGTSGDPCHCPVANFLIEMGTVPFSDRISVGLTRIGLIYNLNDDTITRPELTPGWVARFILAVDSLEKRMVTAERCIQIINEEIDYYPKL